MVRPPRCPETWREPPGPCLIVIPLECTTRTSPFGPRRAVEPLLPWTTRPLPGFEGVRPVDAVRLPEFEGVRPPMPDGEVREPMGECVRPPGVAGVRPREAAGRLVAG